MNQLKRIRVGAGHTQASAAKRAGVTAPLVAQWETSKLITEERLMEIAGRLALGIRRKGELEPRFLVGFWLFGQRFLSDHDGHVYEFARPEDAVEQADLL